MCPDSFAFATTTLLSHRLPRMLQQLSWLSYMAVLQQARQQQRVRQQRLRQEMMQLLQPSMMFWQSRWAKLGS